MTEEQRKVYSEKFSGENNPRYGVKVSDETKLKISKAMKGKIAGEKHPNFGKHLSKETKIKISTANIGHKLSDETKQKIIESNKTRIRKPLSQETKDRIGDMKRGENSPNRRRVAKIDPNTNTILETFPTAVSAGISVGLVNGSQISAACRGKQKLAGGYCWKYID